MATPKSIRRGRFLRWRSLAVILLILLATVTLAGAPLLFAFVAIQAITLSISACLSGIVQWTNFLLVTSVTLLWYILTGQWIQALQSAMEIAQSLGLS